MLQSKFGLFGLSNLHNYLKTKHLSHLIRMKKRSNSHYQYLIIVQANNITMLVSEFVARDMRLG